VSGNYDQAIDRYRNFPSKILFEQKPILAIPLLFTMGWHYNQDYEIKENLQYSNLNLPSSVERENVVREMLSFLKKYTNEKFELAEELLEKGQELEMLDVYEEVLKIDRHNLKAFDSSLTIYMRTSNPDLHPKYVKFDDGLEDSYKIILANKEIFPFEDWYSSLLQKRIKIFENFSDDRKLLELYERLEKDNRFDPEIMIKLAELYVKRYSPHVGLQYYENVLRFLDEDEREAIEEIIDSLRQELELRD